MTSLTLTKLNQIKNNNCKRPLTVIGLMTEDNLPKELKKQIGQLLEQAREDFRTMETSKKERLLKLAKDIESLGYPKDMICETIVKALGNEIKDGYIRQILPKEFKRKYEKPEISENTDRSDISPEKPIELSTSGSIIEDEISERHEIIEGLKQKITRNDEELENLKIAVQKIKDLEDQLNVSRENEKKTNEQLKEQSEYFHSTLKAINDNKDKSILESKEYKALQSEMFLLQEEITQLKQIEAERMRKNPSETFQKATDMQPISNEITTITTTTIPNEVEMPGRDLSTMFLDSRSGCNIMYLQIQGNKVTGWETDKAREKKKAAAK